MRAHVIMGAVRSTVVASNTDTSTGAGGPGAVCEHKCTKQFGVFLLKDPRWLDMMASGFTGNAIYVCGSTSISWTYGKLMGPRVSLMDSSFGVGGSLAPLLAGLLAESALVHAGGA